MSLDLVPMELIFEILLSLPVLTLVQLRVVSKRWRALIDSPNFQKTHFNHSNKLSLQQQKGHGGGSLMIGKFDRHATEYVDLFSFWYSTNPIIHEKLRYPACIGGDIFTNALAPVNGVLCLITLSRSRGAILWNPFIRKHLAVPRPPGSPPPFDPRTNCTPNDCLWSFCYYDNDDDYKLVFIARLKKKKSLVRAGAGYGELHRFPVWVYSVKIGSWKSIGDSPYPLAGVCGPGAFVNGALHFTGCGVSRIPAFIFALDLRNLEYYLVPRPDDEHTSYTNRKNFSIGVLDGCLYFHLYSYGSSDFELWVIKDYYGVVNRESNWTKLISPSMESWTNLISYPPSSRRMLYPIDYAENGKKLLFFEFSSNLIVGYDFETESFKIVAHGFGVISVYTPSLLFPVVAPSRVCLCQ